MRIFAAILYIIFGFWALFQITDETPFWLSLFVFFSLLFSSVIIFNEGFLRLLRGISDEEYLETLLSSGKAKKETYKVLSALSFDDLNTSCAVHILDIGNNENLCLYGQYLYDYEPIDDDPEMNQQRKFPTEEFSLIRKVKEDELLQLIPGIKVIEPIIIKNPNLDKLYDLGFQLKDGEIISEVPFSDVLSTQNKSG